MRGKGSKYLYKDVTAHNKSVPPKSRNPDVVITVLTTSSGDNNGIEIKLLQEQWCLQLVNHLEQYARNNVPDIENNVSRAGQ